MSTQHNQDDKDYMSSRSIVDPMKITEKGLGKVAGARSAMRLGVGLPPSGGSFVPRRLYPRLTPRVGEVGRARWARIGLVPPSAQKEGSRESLEER
jgi:hypothetical protein